MAKDKEREEYRLAFAKWLRTLMRNRYMSGAELSRKSGISYESINCYLCGKTMPSAYSINRLRKALNVSADVLLDNGRWHD